MHSFMQTKGKGVVTGYNESSITLRRSTKKESLAVIAAVSLPGVATAAGATLLLFSGYASRIDKAFMTVRRR